MEICQTRIENIYTGEKEVRELTNVQLADLMTKIAEENAPLEVEVLKRRQL